MQAWPLKLRIYTHVPQDRRLEALELTHPWNKSILMAMTLWLRLRAGLYNAVRVQLVENRVT